MRKVNRVVSAVITACFLLNTFPFDASMAQELFSKHDTAAVSVASKIDDILGPEFPIMRNISMLFESCLVYLRDKGFPLTLKNIQSTNILPDSIVNSIEGAQIMRHTAVVDGEGVMTIEVNIRRGFAAPQKFRIRYSPDGKIEVYPEGKAPVPAVKSFILPGEDLPVSSVPVSGASLPINGQTEDRSNAGNSPVSSAEIKDNTEAARTGPITCPVLVINGGSSSIDYRVIDMLTGRVMLREKIEKIGETEGLEEGALPVKDHDAAINMILADLEKKDISPVVVGHRVVHGGDEFTGSVLITDAVERAIEKFSDLAPLHNPPNLLGIRACKKAFPDIPQVAVFDTAFHQTMPERAYTYAVPRELTMSGVRRYGFHGISHMYVAEEAARRLGRPLSEINLITLHLGNGASVAAIEKGKSIDTSMGLTPLEGLVMGTRTGDIDAGVIFHLMRKGYDYRDLDRIFNKRSGVMGMCGVNDNRDMIALAESGDKDAQLAMEVFIYRICKYVGSYSMALGKVNAVVLTAGIGENGGKVREEIIRRLQDYFTSNFIPERIPQVFSVPTNEGLVIARDSYRLWQSGLFKAQKVILPQNPDRTGEVLFAAIDGVNHLVSHKNIASQQKETPEIRNMIMRLAQGYCALADAYKREHDQEPIIAALSYDTLNPDKPGSRNNFNVYTLDRAIEMARDMRPGINFYGAGSVQFDTALIESIGKKKAGERYIKGKPDIFAFPSFYSYEIALQMVEGIGKDAGAIQVKRQGINMRTADKNNLPIIFLPESGNADIKDAGMAAHKQGLARIAFYSDGGIEPAKIRDALAANPSEPVYAKGKPRTILERGYVDGIVFGIDSPTAKVVQEALMIRAKAKNTGKDTFGVYDYFIMSFPQQGFGADGMASFVNTASHTTPNVEELIEMVPMAAADFESITGHKPVVALLHGEKNMPATVMPAFDKIKTSNPELDLRACDFAQALRDKCNVFVFPDLITGNICYKIAQRVLGAQAWGPFLISMADDKPIEISDLSRGASSEDVLNTIIALSGRISGRKASSSAAPKEISSKDSAALQVIGVGAMSLADAPRLNIVYGSAEFSLQDIMELVPVSWLDGWLKLNLFVKALQQAGCEQDIVTSDDKSLLIFSEKSTFGEYYNGKYEEGIGVILPNLAKSGVKIAVIATTDKQKALIDELNAGRPENERIVYAETVAEVTVKVKAARYYFFKVASEPDAGAGITSITIIVKKIIEAIGQVVQITDSKLIKQIHEAAHKFAMAA